MSPKSVQRQTFEVEIVKYAPPGDGLGFYEDKAVFVPGTAVGDYVRVIPQKVKKNFIIAAVEAVIIPSPDRIEPACPHYATCGGCSLMHLPYDLQLRIKREVMIEYFSKAGLSVSPRMVPSPKTSRFRHRCQVKLEGDVIGLAEKHTHQLVDIPDCLVLSKGIHSRIADLKRLGRIRCEFKLLESNHSGEVAISILEGKRVEALPGHTDMVIENYGFGGIQLSSDGFAQSNPFITRIILADLLKAAGTPKRVTELYCGAGTFSIPLAGIAEKLVGLDISEASISLANENAIAARINNTTFISANLEKRPSVADADIIVADPPRKGMSETILKQIATANPGRVLYVSCNPATLARDAAVLINQYGFKMDSLKGYDMYCHTTHLEAMATFSRD